MTALACGQSEIIPGECAECGGWLDRERRDGYPAQVGRVCSEDCAAGQSVRLATADVRNHLHVRDLLCNCAAVCAPRGLPTDEQRAGHAAWVSGGAS